MADRESCAIRKGREALEFWPFSEALLLSEVLLPPEDLAEVRSSEGTPESQDPRCSPVDSMIRDNGRDYKRIR